MMERNRRFVSCAEEDRINNLPEHLIDSVLSGVPFEDAVRTSILSKKWRYRWTTMRTLVFDEHFSNKFAKNGAFGRNGFIRIINQVLFLHKGPILKFYIHIPTMFLDSFQEVDKWMLYLSRNGVTELVLTNSNRRYELPSYVFSCLELAKLELVNCFFKPPLEFEGFPILEELRLNDIDFGANLCGTHVSLPQLKKLSLRMCTNVYNFNIKATKLQSLYVLTSPEAMLLRLLDSPCLIKVMIFFQQPLADFVRVENMNLDRMLSNLPRVEIFSINRHFLKISFAENIPKWFPNPVNSLKGLSFRSFHISDLDQLHGALCLLRNSPHLKSLRMAMHLETESQVDVGPASNHLESPNCFDFTLNLLETVEMVSLEGSRLELLCIKLILAHSPSLEKFIIRPSRASDFQKRFEIAKDVMQFPRASTKAKVFYLDPMPQFCKNVQLHSSLALYFHPYKHVLLVFHTNYDVLSYHKAQL